MNPPPLRNGRADLHLHTFHSDGTFSPEEVVRRAAALNLAAISVTDHDSTAGLPAAFKAAGDKLEILTGVELTVVFKARELHLLGYGFDPADETFRAFLGRMRQYRQDRIRAMIDRLKTKGIEVTFEEVQAAAGQGIIGRPHLAQVLVERGLVRGLDEAFERYLGDRAPCFVKGATLTVPNGVKLIRDAGGAAVLAHPFRLIQESWLPELADCGVQGIEVFHTDHSAAVAKRYERLARELDLLVTGGSDCHGFRKSSGPTLGTVTVAYDRVERLKAVIHKRGQTPPVENS
ncbi:MAG: PHP domain-containing protein [Candidatus Omnitrophica bacterium]|nr:PHP domain-containing protein [Candidatus Omnitrophota bacterium]